MFSNLSEGYEQMWRAIIRPPRAKYSDQMLGPKVFKYHSLKIQRTDVQLINKRGFKLKCSHYQPFIRPAKQLPCVIYLHGNSSCRIEGRSCIPFILCHDITLFTFDFAGCGNSEGQYISLGYYEKDDVDTVFDYLRSLNSVSSIGLWGRSMGAVTALMYADKNPQIACIVCDSPFSNLEKLCKQLAERFAGGIVSVFSGIALSLIAKTIKQKNNFDIAVIDPLGKHVKKAYIPAFFIAAKDDNFILPKHGEKLHAAYSGEKIFKLVEGDHNSERDEQVNYAISNFFYNNLHVQQLVVKDLKYIEEQKAEKTKQKESQKLQTKDKHIIFHQPKRQLPEAEEYIDQDKMLEMAIRLSLQQSQKKISQPNQIVSKDQTSNKHKQSSGQKQRPQKKQSKNQQIIRFSQQNIEQDQLDQRK